MISSNHELYLLSQKSYMHVFISWNNWDNDFLHIILGSCEIIKSITFIGVFSFADQFS